MCEKEKKMPKPAADTGKQILRGLQGEDGYEIFSDEKNDAEQQRYLREYEDERR